MTIVVTKEGAHPLLDRTFAASCGLCATEVTFTYPDAAWITTVRSGIWVKVASVRCPLCCAEVRVRAAEWPGGDRYDLTAPEREEVERKLWQSVAWPDGEPLKTDDSAIPAYGSPLVVNKG